MIFSPTLPARAAVALLAVALLMNPGSSAASDQIHMAGNKPDDKTVDASLGSSVDNALATLAALHGRGLLSQAVYESRQHALLDTLLLLPEAGPAACRANCTWVDVMEFGAVADGVTDDTAAFVAAMAAIGEGGMFHMPCGRFKLVHSSAPGDKPCGAPQPCTGGCAQLAWPNILTLEGRPNIEIRGEGLCTQLDIYSDTNPRVFGAYNSHSWGLTFRDFTIDQTHALTNSCMFAAGHGAIAITASLNPECRPSRCPRPSLIRNVRFTNIKSSAVQGDVQVREMPSWPRSWTNFSRL
jgi:hypothetical protein